MKLSIKPTSANNVLEKFDEVNQELLLTIEELKSTTSSEVREKALTVLSRLDVNFIPGYVRQSVKGVVSEDELERLNLSTSPTGSVGGYK